MRRIVICLLGLTLTLGIVGCGGEEEPAAPATAPATEGGETPAAPATN
jgi:hypothetical protein